LKRQVPPDVPRPIDTTVGTKLATSGSDPVTVPAGVIAPTQTNDTTKPTVVPPRPRSAQNERVQLSFGGGVTDLDDAALKALIGALDEIDRAPVALSAEPDHAPVLPAGREGTR